MKTKILLLFLISFSGIAKSQTLNFLATQESYTPLNNAISINNGEVWDDPEYLIPMPFEFNLNGVLFKDNLTISDYGVFYTSAEQGDTVEQSLILPFGADLIDRAGEFASMSSESIIAYKVDGQAPTRVLKIEWSNCGFYNEGSETNEYNDFINYQLWIYESTNILEMRYGPNSVQMPELNYDGELGPFVAIVPFYSFDFNNENIGENAISLVGNPSNPTKIDMQDFDDLGYLSSTISDGTMYRFGPSILGVDNLSESNIILSPNPSSDYININSKNGLSLVTISNLNGKVVHTGQSNNIVLDGFKAGIYFAKIKSLTGEERNIKFVKN